MKCRKSWMKGTKWWDDPDNAPPKEEWEAQKKKEALVKARQKLKVKFGREPTLREVKDEVNPPPPKPRKCCGRK